MTKTLICREIKCLYFDVSDPMSSGCKFYESARQCHLLSGMLSTEKTALATDYEIIAEDLYTAEDLIRVENDFYIKCSEKYLRDCELQGLTPEPVRENVRAWFRR